MNELFNYMDYKNFITKNNSMFEKDINSNLSYNDLSRSKISYSNTYEGLVVNDIKLAPDDNIKNILNKLKN